MLKTKPGCVVLIEMVVHTARLHLLGVGAGLRDAPAVRAAIPMRRIAGGVAAVAVERAPQNGKRSSGRTFVEREHLLIEGNRLRRGLIRGAGDRVGAAPRKLL